MNDLTVITSTGTVDVQPLNVTRSPASVTPGGSLSVTWQIRNNGTATAASSNSQIRFTTSGSSNGYGNSSNNVVGASVATGTIAAGATVNQSRTVNAPTTPGTYYVWIVADNNSALNQTNVSNDFAVSSSFTVTAPAQYADLVPQNLAVSPTSGLAGSSVQVSFTVRNNGPGTSSATTANIRLSAASSSAPSSSDPLLGTVNINALSNGSQQSFSPTYTIPAGAAATPRLVWVIVEPDGAPNANQGPNNGNNDRVSIPFTVTAPAASPILTVTPSSPITVPSSAGSTPLSVSNTGGGTMSYTASVISDSPWLSVTPSGASGGNSGTITVSYSANSTGAQRSGTVRITASGASGSPKDVMITQQAGTGGGTITDGFDYPIGNRGYAGGSPVPIPEFPSGIVGVGTESANTLFTGSGVANPKRENNGANSSWWISQDVGAFNQGYGIHAGEDWNRGPGTADVGEIGEIVYAVAAGTVVEIRGGTSQNFWTIVLRHDLDGGDTAYSIYGHVSPFSIGGSANINGNLGTKANFGFNESVTKVSRGDAIARIGSLPSGPHLHFEIRFKTNDYSSKPYFFAGGVTQASGQSSMTAQEVAAAYAHMRAAGIVDLSDFIDARRPGNMPPPLSITTSSPLPNGTVGTAYNQTLEATGGTTPYSWSISTGSLPPGLNLSSAGVISGTPNSATTANFTVRVTGNNGLFSTRAFSLTINNAPTTPITYKITPNPATVGESAGTLIFTITRSGSSLPAETIYASTVNGAANGYAVNAGDYAVNVNNLPVSFTSGATTRTVTVTILNDTVAEPNETFGFIVQRNGSDQPSTYLDKATFTIIDDDQGGATDYSGASWIAAGTGHFTPASRAQGDVTAIVIHTTEDASYGAAITWFQDPSGDTSAHYVVRRDGSIVQMVREKDIAHHAGTVGIPASWIWNQRSIGIEVERLANPTEDITTAQYNAVKSLVDSIRTRYNVPLVFPASTPAGSPTVLVSGIVGHGKAVVNGIDPVNWNWTYFQSLFGNPEGTAPPTPSATAATNLTSGGFTANWNNSSGATGYRLDVSISSTFSGFVIGYQNLDVGNVLNRSVSGLSAGTIYYYRVRAYNSSGTSGNSGTINVTTDASPTRVIVLSGDLTFGNVTVGQTATKTLTITNTGNSPLAVNGISYPPGFSVNWSSGTIAANGGLQNVMVTFSPTAATSYNGNLTVNSNATGGTGARAISGTGATAGVTTLQNGIAATGISGSKDSLRHYKITVPSGPAQLVIGISGGTGDGDLYVRRGAQATTSSYDHRPWLPGNNETVTVPNPQAGDWYVMLHGFDAYSGITLIASFTPQQAQTGSLQVTLAPPEAVSAGTQWKIGNGPWKNSGETVGGLSTGSHSVTFKSLGSGWTTPSSQTVTINANQTAFIAATYVKVLEKPQKAVNPEPQSGATDQGTKLTLTWSNGGRATSYNVYFGTKSSPGEAQLEGERNNTTFTTPNLDAGTKYYWRIDSINAGGVTKGDVWSFTTAPAPIVAAPVITPKGGNFENSALITIASPDATIRYTTNGSNPTNSSPIYSGPFLLTSSATVKAKAFKNGYADSAVVEADFTVVAGNPTISPNGGNFKDLVEVEIDTPVSGATIRYTTDGKDPKSNSAIYLAPLTLTKSATVKARAFKDGQVGSAVASATFTVTPSGETISPNELKGSFVGFIEREPSLNGNLGGRLQVTVSKKGQVSGRLVLGWKTIPFRGMLKLERDKTPRIEAVIHHKELGVLTLKTEFDAGDEMLRGTLASKNGQASIEGWRNIWHRGDSFFAGYYTNVIRVVNRDISESSVPGGNGFATLKTNAKGTASWSGKLADGTKFTHASLVGPDGELLLYVPLYKKTGGSVLGIAKIQDEGGSRIVNGNLDWVKNPESNKKARLYKNGFDFGQPIELDLFGGAYARPENIILNLPDTASNALISFAGGGIEASSTVPDLFFQITDRNKPIISVGQGNPGSVKLTLNPSTGMFKGSFKLTDSWPERKKPLVRTVKFEGLLLPRLNVGAGFFLLPQLPDDSDEIVPIYSGEVFLSPANE